MKREDITEIFLDFGIFEILAVLGIFALSKWLYSRKALGIAFIGTSVVAPGTLLFLPGRPVQHWIAVVCLVTTVVNVGVVGAVLQTGSISSLQFTPGMFENRFQKVLLNRFNFFKNKKVTSSLAEHRDTN